MSYIPKPDLRFIHSHSHETAMIMTNTNVIPSIGETIVINNHLNNENTTYVVKDVKYTYMINRWDDQYLGSITVYI